MSNDNKVIGYLSPAEMAALMTETGMVTVHENVTMNGQPVIHAALKVVNAQTGEQLPGGLPFTVILFKTAREPGYSNIAIGTVVPSAELGLVLPHDYFNFANQHYRFARVFPLDERAFVIQMDLFLHAATREYVKFGFGIWAALFSQVLFDLMGNGGHELQRAVSAYASARTELAQQFVSTALASDEPVETFADVASAPEMQGEAIIPAAEEAPSDEAFGRSQAAEVPLEAAREIFAPAVEEAGGEISAEPVKEAAVEHHDEPESEPEAEPMLPPKIEAVSDGHGDVATTASAVEAEAKTVTAGADAAPTIVKSEAA